MTSGPLNLGDFPSEILDRVLEHVGYKEAVNLSMTSKGFYNTLHDEETGYWKREAQRVFKTPHVDSLINKVPWRYLFRDMAKARVYTWGESNFGKLGHSRQPPPHYMRSQGSVAVPVEILGLRHQFVVDIIAGGWSTSFLTSDGNVYISGPLAWAMGQGRYGDQLAEPARIRFPEPIYQISSGRGHLIALSNKGRIYTCTDRVDGPRRVNLSVPVVDSDPECLTPDKIGKVEEEIGRVKKVVGGWDRCAALISGVGIVVWIPASPDGTTSLEPYQPTTIIIQDTGNLQKPLWQVVDFVLGEGYLVFLTVSGKVFGVFGLEPAASPVELEHFSSPEGQLPMTRISGSFRRFAVFNKEGMVRMGSNDTVRNIFEGKKEGIKPAEQPDFTGYRIVDVVFGDYHGLALTDEGKVLSWGTESQMCGCLGLGDRLPGMSSGPPRYSSDLEVTNPQVVSFKPPTGGSTGADESEGDDQTKYYAFKVTAAGWHSGALLLALDEDHSRDKNRIPEGSKAQVDDRQGGSSRTSHFGHPPVQREFDEATLGPGGRERGHRGIRGVTGTSFLLRGGMSRAGFVRSGLQGRPTVSLGEPAQTGGVLELGGNDRLSQSREAERGLHRSPRM